jgi:hypothetical protein
VLAIVVISHIVDEVLVLTLDPRDDLRHMVVLMVAVVMVMVMMLE